MGPGVRLASGPGACLDDAGLIGRQRDDGQAPLAQQGAFGKGVLGLQVGEEHRPAQAADRLQLDDCVAPGARRRGARDLGSADDTAFGEALLEFVRSRF